MRRISRNTPSGSSRSSSPVLSVRPRCSRQSRAGCHGRASGPRHRGRPGRGLTLVERRVDDCARQLGVVGPRAAVDVVGAGDHPYVVDDADLGVDVDRRALRVLDVADAHPIAAGPLDDPHGALATDPARGSRDPTVAIGEPGTTTITWRSGFARNASASACGGALRPEVLVLEVYEAPSPPERLDVGACDAALAVGREGIYRTLGRIGAQDLHCVWADRRRVARPWRERVGVAGLPRQRARRRATGLRWSSGVGSSQRSRKVSAIARPPGRVPRPVRRATADRWP